jgi:hypothetical protein
MEKFKNISTQEIEEELKNRKVLENMPKKLKNINYKEIEDFAESIVSGVIKDGCYPKDYEVYMTEAVLQSVYGQDIYKILNKYS